jgi:hypothetical protein
MLCNKNTDDRLLRALVEKGIHLVFPPRDLISVGELILWEKGNFVRTARWETVVGIEVHPKGEFEDGFEATSFTVNSNTEISLTAKVLGRFFGSESAQGKINAEANRLKAQSVQLSLIAPAFQNLGNLDDLLEELRAHGAEPYELYKERRFFVVTTAWRAKGFNLAMFGMGGTNASISAEAASDIATDLGLRAEAKISGDYAFKADRAKIFGVTLREITFGGNGIVDKVILDPMIFRSGENAFSYIGDDLFYEINQEQD